MNAALTGESRPPLLARLMPRDAILRRAVQNWRDRVDLARDRAWNVDTITLPDAIVRDDANADGKCYEPIRYPILERYVKPLHAGADDVVYDIGSGLGRALHVFARQGVRRCVGIELVPALAEKARRNAESLRGRRCPIETRIEDAATADYSDGTVFLLFNPFGATTMKAVIDRIRESIDANPRTVRIGYVVPKYEHVLAEAGWLRCTGRRSSPFHRVRASYWTSA